MKVALALAFLLCPVTFAQAPKRLEFEVASVRPSAPNQGQGATTPAASQINPSQVRLTYLPFRDLVQRAYQVKAYQVIGPDWTMAQRYDIIATLPEGATAAQIPEMLKSLLEDRFGLKSHKAQKEFSVYTLEQGKRPFTLKEVQPTDDPEGIVVVPTQSGNGVAMRLGRGASFSLSDAKFDGKGMSMEMLASISSQFLTVPAVDRTGLKGFYDLHVDLNPEDFGVMMTTAAAKRGVSVSPQIMEQLEASKPGSFFSGLDKVGLKLEKGKAFLDVITIDEAKQMPTEN